MTTSTIGELKAGRRSPVYTRDDGRLWKKFDEKNQLPVKRLDNHWVGAGVLIDIDPNEKVEVLHFAEDRVA